MTDTNMKKHGFLDWVERVGNKIPHPFILFCCLAAEIIIVSAVSTATLLYG